MDITDRLRPAPRLCVAVPCKDEAETLPRTHAAIAAELKRMADAGDVTPDSYAVYVDDGSDDGTWSVIEGLVEDDPGYAGGVKLTANTGHQNALLAALEAAADSDAVITMDADLQDDPAAMPAMVRAYREGAEIVYGVRRDRSCDKPAKRWSARLHYRMLKALGVKTVYDHGDYRLMSRSAVEALGRYTERNIYLRGIVAQLGFKQATVHYTRAPRRSGRSKYPLTRMLNLAIDGITSFSVRPVRMVFVTGLLFLIVSLVLLVYVLIRHYTGHTLEGWTSLFLSVWFCSGVLLMGMGVIGEYVGKIYTEVKHRPRSHVETRCGLCAEDGAARQRTQRS